MSGSRETPCGVCRVVRWLFTMALGYAALHVRLQVLCVRLDCTVVALTAVVGACADLSQCVFYDNESWNIRETEKLGLVGVYTPNGLTEQVSDSGWTNGGQNMGARVSGC